MFSLEKKSVVITGGASGIGKAIAVLFAQQDAKIHIVDTDENNLEKTAAEIASKSKMVHYHVCDIRNQQQVIALFKEIAVIDILVNNAGIAHIGKAGTTTESDFDKVYQVNVKGAYNCIFSCIPHMLHQGSGVILNTASIAAHVGIADRFAYSASKGAISAMTLSVARDYLKDNIRCNSISPARVHTPFVDGFIERNYPHDIEGTFAKLSASQPIGRMAKPEEVAALALFLCSDEAAFISGCDYPIDGGFIKLNN